MRKVLVEAATKYQKQQIGKFGQVLWESSETQNEGYLLQGLSETFIRISAPFQINLWNIISPVRFVEVGIEGIRGEIPFK